MFIWDIHVVFSANALQGYGIRVRVSLQSELRTMYFSLEF